MHIFINILISFLASLGISLVAVQETVRIVRRFKIPYKIFPFSAIPEAVPAFGGIAIYISKKI